MLLNIILVLITAALGAVCLLLAGRCCGAKALRLGRRELALRVPLPDVAGQRFTRAMGWKALLWALGVLAALYGFVFFQCAVKYDAVTWENYQLIWRHWDSTNYVRIAELGYAGYDEQGRHTLLVFFPLYSWLIRLLHLAVSDYYLCGHILSALCYVGACRMFARLVTEEFGWPAARLGLGLLSAFPFAFFFAACFQESLFLLLALTSFYLIRRHRWLAAGLAGLLAAMTRMQGLLLLFAGGVEYCVSDDPLRRIRERDWAGLRRGIGRKLLPLALILGGTAVYLAINWAVDGNCFQFVIYQREVWDNGFAPLPTCLRTLCQYLFRHWGEETAFALWGAQLAVFAMGFAALLYGARRLPPAWTAYSLAAMLMNYSLAWPMSCGRYTSCVFPLFTAAALALRRRPGLAQGVLLLLTLAQAALFITFLNGGQVM